MAEKTEQPTPQKLQEARKKGQVSKSNDLTQSFLFLIAAGVLSMGGGAYVNELESLMRQTFQPTILSGQLDHGAILRQIANSWTKFLLLSAPLLGALCAGSIAASFLQVQGVFSMEVFKLNFEKLNPVQGFQNLFFKSKTYIELAKGILKLLVIGYLAYVTIRPELRDVILTSRVGLPSAADLASKLFFSLMFKVGVVFLIIGAVDFLIQRKLFMKNLMMSKEDIIREYKQQEGDPHIKHQRKHLHQEMLAGDVGHNVKKANVVVVNPTHLAIAIEYQDKIMGAPAIAAKGEMTMAQRIIHLAKENKIPIMRNVPLAHSLYKLDVGAEIPEELYEAVAEVLNWVYQLSAMDEA